jgi:hypothetical protein
MEATAVPANGPPIIVASVGATCVRMPKPLSRIEAI